MYKTIKQRLDVISNLYPLFADHTSLSVGGSHLLQMYGTIIHQILWTAFCYFPSPASQAAADKEASGGGGGEGEDTAMANLTHALEGGTLDADPFLQEYRAKRLGELKQQAKRGSQRLASLRGSQM